MEQDLLPKVGNRSADLGLLLWWCAAGLLLLMLLSRSHPHLRHLIVVVNVLGMCQRMMLH